MQYFFSDGVRSQLRKAIGASLSCTPWFGTLETAISEASHCRMNSRVKSGIWSHFLTKGGLDCVKSFLLFCSPQKCSVFAVRTIERFRNARKVGDETTIEYGHPKIRRTCFRFFGGGKILNYSNLFRIYANASERQSMSKKADFFDPQHQLGWVQVETRILESQKYLP